MPDNQYLYLVALNYFDRQMLNNRCVVNKSKTYDTVTQSNMFHKHFENPLDTMKLTNKRTQNL